MENAGQHLSMQHAIAEEDEADLEAEKQQDRCPIKIVLSSSADADDEAAASSVDSSSGADSPRNQRNR